MDNFNHDEFSTNFNNTLIIFTSSCFEFRYNFFPKLLPPFLVNCISLERNADQEMFLERKWRIYILWITDMSVCWEYNPDLFPY